MVEYSRNSSNGEAETGRARVQGQHGLHTKILSQKKKSHTHTRTWLKSFFSLSHCLREKSQLTYTFIQYLLSAYCLLVIVLMTRDITRWMSSQSSQSE
jgi:hypothetical protein